MKTLVPVDEDRKVVLYTRDLKQGKTYYARFRVSKTNLSNNQEYIREIMQTPNMEIATTRALQRFAEITILQNNDMVIRGKKVEQGIQDFINEYKDRLEEGWSNYSAHMLRIYRRHVQNYWIRNLMLTIIQTQTIPLTHFLSEFPYEKPDCHSLPDPYRASWKCGKCRWRTRSRMATRRRRYLPCRNQALSCSSIREVL